MVIGTHDRQESDEEMRVAVRNIQRIRDIYDELGDLPNPAPGSVLELERRHTSLHPTDAAVADYRARARDNLDQLFATMMDQESGRLLARPYAQYSMIRAAIEAASMALWLVQSSKKPVRVLRCLQVSYRDVHDRYKLAALLAEDGPKLDAERDRRDKLLRRLDELKNTLDQLEHEKLRNPPQYTEIMQSVSGGAPKPGGGSTYEVISPFVIWKLSSAFLHGSTHVTRVLSDIRQVTEFTGGLADFEMTPSLQILSASIGSCVFTLRDADARYAYLATHDHAGRAVA